MYRIVEVEEISPGKRIKQLMKNNNMTIEQLAEACEVSRQAVSKWLNDQNKPREVAFKREWSGGKTTKSDNKSGQIREKINLKANLENALGADFNYILCKQALEHKYVCVDDKKIELELHLEQGELFRLIDEYERYQSLKKILAFYDVQIVQPLDELGDFRYCIQKEKNTDTEKYYVYKLENAKTSVFVLWDKVTNMTATVNFEWIKGLIDRIYSDVSFALNYGCDFTEVEIKKGGEQHDI